MIYPRRDMQAIGPVPGCDQQHLRPKDPKTGQPMAIWPLDCPAHEAHYRGDGKPRILKYQTDPKTGQVLRQERVPDSDPRFGSTPDTIPLTPDEERTNAVRSERGRMQIEMLQALAALRSTGVEVPPEAMWLLERELPAGVLRGTMLCVNGHDNASGLKFCGECGVSMSARASLEQAASDAEPAVVDLSRLHVRTLAKMARDRGLPDKGSKDELIGRIQAA